MEGFLDIYTKLIIGIISFIAPMTVYLLSIFSKGIAIIKAKGEIEQKQIRELIRDNLTVGNVNSKTISKSNKALKKAENRSDRRVRLLTPTRQIFRIFSSLFFSLLFVMIYKVVKDRETFKMYDHTTCVMLLISSLALFIVGILILRQVVWAAIRTKIMLEQEESAVSIQPQQNP